ncbi:MAG TPA: type II toxin-antitoxin system Phd/YefM family antitoxin [Pricia sp.]|nr:type II toxin-antitoxin system Phd/YefM family antitoxin [Pricia sp.]
METTNATELRKNLKRKLDTVSEDKETLIIHRSGQEDVVMIPLSEYNSWKETLYLLSTKGNRANLDASIKEAENGAVESIKSDDLWK